MERNLISILSVNFHVFQIWSTLTIELFTSPARELDKFAEGAFGLKKKWHFVKKEDHNFWFNVWKVFDDFYDQWVFKAENQIRL